jgi:A/G-specific adenine glycosylase
VDEIGELLEPIGLWRRRPSWLMALAGEMAARGGEFPRTRGQLESLPGVGQYIANSILLFAAGKAEPLLDLNMARVLERSFGPRKLVDIRDDPHLQSVARAVVRGTRAAEVNWAILDLAATACTVREPRCAECPLRRHCQDASRHEVRDERAYRTGQPGRSGPDPGAANERK